MARKAIAKDSAGHPVRVKAEVRQDFTTDKYKERTELLTRKMREVELQEEAIKAEAAKAKSELKSMRAEVNELANQLRNGYEMVEVEAFVVYLRKKGKKKLLYNAPGQPHHEQLIREEPMTEDDYQQLPLELPEAPEPEPLDAK